MGVRRKARECALQVLFAQERGPMAPGALAAFWEDAAPPAGAKDYAERLVQLVKDHGPEVDAAITAAAENWTLERMGRVDRNLLRVAVAELLFVDDVPVRVALDEAIEIAKRFGGDDSGRFVNGILDRIAREVPQEDPEPAPEADPEGGPGGGSGVPPLKVAGAPGAPSEAVA